MEKLEETVENPQAQERIREAKQKTIQHLNNVKEKLMERSNENKGRKK